MTPLVRIEHGLQSRGDRAEKWADGGRDGVRVGGWRWGRW